MIPPILSLLTNRFLTRLPAKHRGTDGGVQLGRCATEATELVVPGQIGSSTRSTASELRLRAPPDPMTET
jgi:hypothetical protein